jgi:hypothetical protein
MAKTKISEFSSTAADNTDITNINIAEGCSPANLNNAVRGLMAQLKDFQSANPTYYTADSDALAIGAGGTGAITATTARTNLSAAKSGANSDITSITGLTTALSTTQGGTGAVQRAISNVARTSNVVTITTSTNHGFLAGEYVTVTATTNTSVNGTFLIATVSTNTFTYAQTGSNITSVADTGTAVDITYCNLVNNVTGTLTVANGGTGVTTNTPNAILVGNATSAISSIKPGTNANVLTSTAGSTVNAGSFVVGTEYTILTVGSTNFQSIGASSNTVGVVFTATGVGSGNGTATTNTWTSSALPSSITRATAQATTSGTSIDFTSIPSWVKRITVMFNGVSTTGSSQIIIQIGNSSPETSGYSGTGAGVTSSNITSTGGGITSGFTIDSNAQASAASTRNGIATIALLTGSTYVFNSVVSGNNYVSMLGYSKTTSTVIDRIRITTVNGTDTFDAGSVNILYE